MVPQATPPDKWYIWTHCVAALLVFGGGPMDVGCSWNAQISADVNVFRQEAQANAGGAFRRTS